jgi:hypothetical protein
VNAELKALVTEFHKLYNEQRFGEIYDRSSRLFQRRMSRAARIKFFADLYAKDGRVVSTTQENQAGDTQFAGRTHVLTYTTKFEHGSLSEFIGFRESATERGGVLLAAYERD